MALSMEEQRILAEIETRLSEEDPRLDHRLSRFDPPGGCSRGRLIARTALAAAAVFGAAALAILVVLA